MFSNYQEFSELKGRTLTKIDVSVDTMEFHTDKNEVYELYHEQDCCESVTIEDICGDLLDLLEEPILLAEEIIHEQDVNPEGVIIPKYQDSFTWTFYKLSTIKGSVAIRWHGDSNGYYSEKVDFRKIK